VSFFCEEEEQSMSEVATPKDAHEVERLRSEIIAWLATTRPDGHPNIAPVWFLWEDPCTGYLVHPFEKSRHKNEKRETKTWVQPLSVVDNSDFSPNGLTAW
jgi:hypothetical protein